MEKQWRRLHRRWPSPCGFQAWVPGLHRWNPWSSAGYCGGRKHNRCNSQTISLLYLNLYLNLCNTHKNISEVFCDKFSNFFQIKKKFLWLLFLLIIAVIFPFDYCGNLHQQDLHWPSFSCGDCKQGQHGFKQVVIVKIMP